MSQRKRRILYTCKRVPILSLATLMFSHVYKSLAFDHLSIIIFVYYLLYHIILIFFILTIHTKILLK